MPTQPKPNLQAGIMLHPAAALRKALTARPQPTSNTMPNLAAGHRELLRSLASERRSTPAPPGYLSPIGTHAFYQFIVKIDKHFQDR